jgi:hypothetical protein
MHDEQYEADIAARLRDLRVELEAKRRLDEELYVAPPIPTSLYDQMAQERPKVDWIIHELAPAGIVQLNAEAKGGKTSVVQTAVYALAMNEPFLGRFKVNVKPDERFAVLNMELPEEQFNAWFDRMGMTDEAKKRIEPFHAMTHGFRAVDFSNDRAVEWTIKWLRDNGITVLFGDPTAKLFNASKWPGDVNQAYTSWFQVVEDVARQAGLRLVWLNTHTGFGAESADRSRGASAMMDNPTVNMVLRHNGQYGKPPGRERWLSARGRDVDVKEFEIVHDQITRLYTATGNGTRAEAGGEQMQGHRALEAWRALAKHHSAERAKGNKGDIKVTAGKLAELCGIRPTDKHSGEHRSGRSIAVDRNWISTEGNGNKKLFWIGETTPDGETHPDEPPPRNRFGARALREDNNED